MRSLMGPLRKHSFLIRKLGNIWIDQRNCSRGRGPPNWTPSRISSGPFLDIGSYCIQTVNFPKNLNGKLQGKCCLKFWKRHGKGGRRNGCVASLAWHQWRIGHFLVLHYSRTPLTGLRWSLGSPRGERCGGGFLWPSDSNPKQTK